MTPDALHPLAEDYLQRLRRAGRQLPPERLRELTEEIGRHLSEAIPRDASNQEAMEVLDRLGSPVDIVESERPPAIAAAETSRRRERAAVLLLPLGGFALGVGWLVGVALLWSSRLWTTREKLIGTLVVPGGIATVILVALLTATKRRCTTFTTIHRASGVLLERVPQCTPSTGPSALAMSWHIALVVICVLGPIISAIYLARRARIRSGFGNARPA